MSTKVNNSKIVSAMLSLIKKKSYTEITIKDLIEEAQISRSSFYYYYKTKDEVIQFAFEDFLIEITAILSQDLSFGYGVLYQMASYIYDCRDLCDMFLQQIENVDQIVKDHISALILNATRTHTLANLENNLYLPQEYALEVYVTALHLVFIKWLKDPGNYSAREFASFLYNFTEHCVR